MTWNWNRSADEYRLDIIVLVQKTYRRHSPGEVSKNERGIVNDIWRVCIRVWIDHIRNISPCHTRFTQDSLRPMPRTLQMSQSWIRSCEAAVFHHRAKLRLSNNNDPRQVVDPMWRGLWLWPVVAESGHGIAIIPYQKQLAVQVWIDEDNQEGKKSSLARIPYGCIPTEIDEVWGVGD